MNINTRVNLVIGEKPKKVLFLVLDKNNSPQMHDVIPNHITLGMLRERICQI